MFLFTSNFLMILKKRKRHMKDNDKILGNKWTNTFDIGLFNSHMFPYSHIYFTEYVINDCLMSQSCILCLLLQLHLIYYLNDQGQIELVIYILYL